MNSYNPANTRSTLVAALCAVLFSATCLAGALAPAQVARPASSPSAASAVA